MTCDNCDKRQILLSSALFILAILSVPRTHDTIQFNVEPQMMSICVGEFLYWSSVEIPLNPTQVVNTRTLMAVREKYEHNNQAVRATSYALLLYLEHNEFAASTPIMKWIQTQHNALVGWDSSLDSLLALQALTAFALRETNRDIFSMEIIIEATQPQDPPWKHTIRLNHSNFAEVQEFNVSGRSVCCSYSLRCRVHS